MGVETTRKGVWTPRGSPGLPATCTPNPPDRERPRSQIGSHRSHIGRLMAVPKSGRDFGSVVRITPAIDSTKTIPLAFRAL